jgi:glycosyltransferase involved in cell wall biosynthesis
MSAVKDSRRLSVAMIVRDAAEALRETLMSIRGVADEIVVAETGSADASSEVATESGATLIALPWQDDFAAARNACRRHVTGDWVLWLDAGERLSPADAQALREFVQRQADAKFAYAMLVHVPPSGPGAAGEQVARVRLLPNHVEIVYEGRIRESVSNSLAAHGINIDSLPYRIRRGTRDHHHVAKAIKARRNIRLCDVEIRERGVSAHLLNCLGDAFQTLDDNERARECFQHALKASEKGSADMLEACYGLVTSMDGDESQRDRQLSACVEALEVFPLDAQLLCAMGGYLHAQGRADLARKSYQTAHQFGQVNPVVWHVDEIREIAAICYSIALQLENQAEAAKAVLEDACQASPSCLRLRRHLLDFHVKRGERDLALQQVDHLPPETPHREALRSAVRGACLAAQKNWIPAKAYLKTAHAAGCRDVICLRWLATVHLLASEIEEARPLIMDWLQVEPQSADAAKYREIVEAASSASANERQLRIDSANTPGIAPPTAADLTRHVRNPADLPE